MCVILNVQSCLVIDHEAGEIIRLVASVRLSVNTFGLLGKMILDYGWGRRVNAGAFSFHEYFYTDFSKLSSYVKLKLENYQNSCSI